MALRDANLFSFGKAKAVPQAAYRNRPPLLDDVTVEGPTRRSSAKAVLRTLEDYLKHERDYNWFRYSNTALPCLLFIGLIAVTLLCLTFWTGNFNIKGMRDGIPRYVEFPTDSDDLEAGLDRYQRDIRIAETFFALAGVFLLWAVFMCKPTPVLGRIFNVVIVVLVLLPALVLAWVGFGFDVGDLSAVHYCTRGGLRGIYTAQNGSPLNLANQNFLPAASMAHTQPCEGKGSMITALTVFQAVLGALLIVLILLVLYFTWTGDWVRKRNPRDWRQRENDVERNRPVLIRKDKVKPEAHVRWAKKNKTNKILVSVALSAVFVLAVLVLVFTIVIHEYRGQIVSEAQALNAHPLTQPEAGWSVRNIRLRLAVSAATILIILFNLIPARSRVLAQVYGLAYFALSVLAFTAFAYDMRELLDVDDRACPAGFDCKRAIFVAIVTMELLLALWLLGYVLVEYVSLLFFRCKHNGRELVITEVGKYSKYLSGARPVISEITGQEYSAAEWVYKARHVEGENHVRDPNSGVYVPEWGIQAHMDEDPNALVKCTMCQQTFKRCDMPEAVKNCPYRPVTCPYTGLVFKQKDLAEFHKTCGEVPVPCPLMGPSVMILRKNLDFWLKHECPMRLVESELTGKMVPAYKLEQHNAEFLKQSAIPEWSRRVTGQYGDEYDDAAKYGAPI